MGAACCTPADEGGKAEVDEVQQLPAGAGLEAPESAAPEPEPAAEPPKEEPPVEEPLPSPVPTPRGFKPRGVGFIFKSQEPEQLTFRENKNAEVLEAKMTDPKTIKRAWYGDPKEAWSDEKGVNVLDKLRGYLKEGKDVAADNGLFGDPSPGVQKVLLVERTFTVIPLDMTNKPLGMTFRDKAPIVITRLTEDGHAKERGVQVGWELVKVGDDDLAGKKYKEIMKLIKAAIEKLDG